MMDPQKVRAALRAALGAPLGSAEIAAGVGLWGWTSSPSRSTRDLLTRLHRLAYPT